MVLEVGEGYERGQNVQNILGISSWLGIMDDLGDLGFLQRLLEMEKKDM